MLSNRFITRVWTEDVSDWLLNLDNKIDVLLINSCLWDINRWGPLGPKEFKTNLQELLDLVPKILSEKGEFMWLTTPPGKHCGDQIILQSILILQWQMSWHPRE